MEKKIRIVNKSNHRLPEYATVGSAGFDIKANIDEPIRLKPLERVLVPTGLYVALPDDYELQIRPRSGMAAKYGVTVLNTPGTIDSDYRGEIKVILANLSDTPYMVNPGERIAQGVLSTYTKAVWDEVETLDETSRGNGGFGSTGN